MPPGLLQTKMTWIDNPHFRPRALGDSIRLIPNYYGRLQELGLFVPKMLRGTSANIDLKGMEISLIQTQERNAPAHKNRRSKGNTRPISIPHLGLEDQIDADDLIDALPWGARGDWDVPYLQELVMEIQIELALKHFQTLEYLCWGALNGKIFDADNERLLVDLYDLMGMARVELDYMFGHPETNSPIQKISAQLKDYYTVNSKGEDVKGVHVLCSRTFFNNLVGHPEVKEAYKFYASPQNPLRNDLSELFFHENITYEVHLGKAIYHKPDGSSSEYSFIADGEAIALPIVRSPMTSKIFKTYYAPGTGFKRNKQTAKTLYSRVLPDPSGKDLFVTVDSESNPLPLVQRPDLIVHLKSNMTPPA
jgi:Phage major capsid protein E